jgi:hypothetical protein
MYRLCPKQQTVPELRCAPPRTVALSRLRRKACPETFLKLFPFPFAISAIFLTSTLRPPVPLCDLWLRSLIYNLPLGGNRGQIDGHGRQPVF